MPICPHNKKTAKRMAGAKWHFLVKRRSAGAPLVAGLPPAGVYLGNRADAEHQHQHSHDAGRRPRCA